VATVVIGAALLAETAVIGATIVGQDARRFRDVLEQVLREAANSPPTVAKIRASIPR
jgi:hypothetical protein